MPTFGELSPDLSAFDVAAARLRGAVQPPGGRPEGVTTKILENYLPHMFGGLASLPQRATTAAGDLQRTGEYDAGPAIETAMLMAGARLPFVKPGDVGRVAGLAPVAKEAPVGIRAYHGSPHDFDRFDMSNIGTGEGFQAYGHGLYFADNPATAEVYRAKLAHGPGTIQGQPVPELAAAYDNGGWLTGTAPNKSKIASYLNSYGNAQAARAALVEEKDLISAAHLKLLEATGKIKQPGKTYEINIKADPEHFLDWDKPLPADFRPPHDFQDFVPRTGKELYRAATRVHGSPEAASKALAEAGIPGIKYLDEGSRNNLAVLPDNPMTNEARKFLADAGGNTEKAGKLFRDSNPVERWAVPERDQIYGLIQKGGNKPTSNFVLFRDDIVDIMRKYGLAGLMGAGGLAAAKKGDGGT